MKILVVGGTGATGKLLLAELLERGLPVKAVVRSADRIPEEIRTHRDLEVVEGTVLDMSDEDLETLVEDVDAVASCLGHNLSCRGLFGPPRRLVRDTLQRLCSALGHHTREYPGRVILMNTNGNHHAETDPPISLAQRLVLSLLRLLIPPHADNEAAADFLLEEIGASNPSLEWVILRPDSLIEEESLKTYSLHPSPTRSAIFDPGKTSRRQVAHVMARFLTEDRLWKQWEGKMPVLYREEP